MSSSTVSEVAIEAVIHDYNAGVFLSVKAAAKGYNLSRTTLARRLQGGGTRILSHQYEQKLSDLIIAIADI